MKLKRSNYKNILDLIGIIEKNQKIIGAINFLVLKNILKKSSEIGIKFLNLSAKLQKKY